MKRTTPKKLIRRRLLRWGLFIGLAGVLFYFFSPGDGNETKVWHSVILSEEFTEAKLGSVRTFNEYRQLEERLFLELEEKVYKQTDTGKAFELCRYSMGSTVNSQHTLPNWNKSFELPSDSPSGGVLLLHGMSDSPYSLRGMAETLNQRGYYVIGLRLPGHGTVPSGLKNLKWEDMAAAVQLATQHLKVKIGSQPLHIIGYSTGASLALNYTLDALEGTVSPVPAALVFISPAIGISAAAGLAGVKDWLSSFPGFGNMAWLAIQPEFDPYKYNSFATNAAYQVHRITRAMSDRIATLSKNNPPEKFPPLLIFQSAVDATVSVSAVVDRLLIPLKSQKHELVLFDINRLASQSSLMVPSTALPVNGLMEDRTLPFVLNLITNESTESTAVVEIRKVPGASKHAEIIPLNLNWPAGVVSLSHVALPFSPDDHLYGQYPPDDSSTIFLGQMALKGEYNMLKIPVNLLLRLRYNPFYEFLESRAVKWVDSSSGLNSTQH